MKEAWWGGDVMRRVRSAVLPMSVCVMVVLWLGCAEALASGWMIEPAPRASAAPEPSLGGLSCTSSTFCTAVGGYSRLLPQNSGGPALSERWNGMNWSIQATPSPAGAMSSFLASVSCLSAADCTAVGDVDERSMLVEHWDGITWSIEGVPNPPGPGGLDAVSCASPTACVVVGGFTNEPRRRDLTLAERWDGTKWSIQRTPNPATAIESNLNGVSCATTANCVAVGTSVNRAGRDFILTERWNGAAWSIQHAPRPPGASGSDLYGVSCTPTTACTAVGFADRRHSSQPLVERWNGSRWSIQRSPTARGAADGQLEAVSCTSRSACVAVGESSGTTLAERWNGTRWSIQRTPNPVGALVSNLYGVSCPLVSVCSAVGSFVNASGTKIRVLIERYS